MAKAFGAEQDQATPQDAGSAQPFIAPVRPTGLEGISSALTTAAARLGAGLASQAKEQDNLDLGAFVGKARERMRREQNPMLRSKLKADAISTGLTRFGGTAIRDLTNGLNLKEQRTILSPDGKTVYIVDETKGTVTSQSFATAGSSDENTQDMLRDLAADLGTDSPQFGAAVDNLAEIDPSLHNIPGFANVGVLVARATGKIKERFSLVSQLRNFHLQRGSDIPKEQLERERASVTGSIVSALQGMYDPSLLQAVRERKLKPEDLMNIFDGYQQDIMSGLTFETASTLGISKTDMATRFADARKNYADAVGATGALTQNVANQQALTNYHKAQLDDVFNQASLSLMKQHPELATVVAASEIAKTLAIMVTLPQMTRLSPASDPTQVAVAGYTRTLIGAMNHISLASGALPALEAMSPASVDNLNKFLLGAKKLANQSSMQLHGPRILRLYERGLLRAEQFARDGQLNKEDVIRVQKEYTDFKKIYEKWRKDTEKLVPGSISLFDRLSNALSTPFTSNVKGIGRPADVQIKKSPKETK